MHQAFKVLAMACAVAGFVAAEAQAEPRATASTTPQVPHCTRNVGSISIRNGDTAGWIAIVRDVRRGALAAVLHRVLPTWLRLEPAIAASAAAPARFVLDIDAPVDLSKCL